MEASVKTDLPLDERIAAAFEPGVASKAVAALIAETEAAAVSAGELAERARERALDPTITPDALEVARRESEDAVFSRDRMRAAVVRLRDRLAEVQGQEQQARRQASYEAAKAERDRLAEELARVYPGLAAQLADLAKRISINNEAIERTNRKRPTGAEQLEGAEFVARGVDGRLWQAVPKLCGQLRLPAFEGDRSKPYLWPASV